MAPASSAGSVGGQGRGAIGRWLQPRRPRDDRTDTPGAAAGRGHQQQLLGPEDPGAPGPQRLPSLLGSARSRSSLSLGLKADCQDLEDIECREPPETCDDAALPDSPDDAPLLEAIDDVSSVSFKGQLGEVRQPIPWHVKLACIAGACCLALASGAALCWMAGADGRSARSVRGAQGRRRRAPPGPEAPLIRTRAPAELTFYMYRAQSDAEYPLQNVNAANLPGVLWYLHNEIVVTTPRKYGVTRILRFKITMRNTQEYFGATNSSFGPFVAFDSAQCTVPGCSEIWRKYGYIVGCQNLDGATSSYRAPSTGRTGIWYSLPGPCPSSRYDSKSEQCNNFFPGGACEQVTGYRTCTYHTEPAGEVSLDELVGIGANPRFLQDGGTEYDVSADRGVGLDFWDKKHDQAHCNRRAERLQGLFATRYPDLPASLDEPQCQ